MRAFVFTDKALAKHAGQFVWLSIDTEKSGNAAFAKKYPIRVWPSLFVIDPEKETIALRWAGGATVGQLEKLLAQGERAVRGGRKGAEAALASADTLYGEGKYAEAAGAYRDAIRLLPADSPQYARAVDALLFCLRVDKRYPECVDLARQALPKLRLSPSSANVAPLGLDCALRLPANAPGRAEALASLEADVRAIVSNSRLPLSADDRSSLFEVLVDAREDAKDQAGARAAARQWVEYLDGVAATLTDPEQRTALDPNRLGAYRAAGQIEKAIPMLEQSERDFPGDYNPPARLALVYLRLKRYDEAQAASDRALKLVYGPRRVRVLEVQADIYAGQGDAAASRRTLEDALRFAEELPLGQRSDSQIAALKKRLAPTAVTAQ
jgi:tetratricopeptide (TPR) repeat protein